MSPQDKLVAIGRVVKPHGVRGELCVENHASSPDLYAVGRALRLRLPRRPDQTLAVVGVRPHQGRLLGAQRLPGGKRAGHSGGF